VICEGDNGVHVCLKFYEDSEAGRHRLHSHAHFLEVLDGVIPVPGVLGLEDDALRFGAPALVTTFIGAPLDGCIAAITGSDREQLVADFASAVAALANVDTLGTGLRAATPKEVSSTVRKMLVDDAQWYVAHVPRDEGRIRELVLRGAEALATATAGGQKACLTHRDLCSPNVMVKDGVFSGIVDWDHAGVDAPERDVGVCIAGLLVTLPISKDERAYVVRRFLESYSERRPAERAEARALSRAFALDALLDWLIGGKNAPRSDLVWATSLVLDDMSLWLLG
jgi:aminoglycoside phosphotransferase (APT) family kinase protein